MTASPPPAGWRVRAAAPIAPSAAEPVAREPNAADVATTQPHVPPERDQLSRNNLRGLVERVFKGKLADRELAPYDYERLVDAVMRLRSALGILRRAEKSQASAAALDEQRQAVLSALANIGEITGVWPSELGNVLAPDDDLTGAESIAPNSSP